MSREQKPGEQLTGLKILKYVRIGREHDETRLAKREPKSGPDSRHTRERKMATARMEPLLSWLPGFQISLISAAVAVVPGWSRWIPPRFADEFAPRSPDRLALHTARRCR